MHAVASSDGLLMYTAATVISPFTWLDRAGTRLATVGDVGDYGSFRLSLDGRRIAAPINRQGGGDLLLLDVERGVGNRVDTAAGSTYPVWSPDSQMIAYASGTPRNLSRKGLSGTSGEERLTRSPNTQFATDWSRDGRFILYFERDPATGIDLWYLPLTGEGVTSTDIRPRPYLRTRFTESLARFSPEPTPRWVAYQSDESGRLEIYVDRFPEPRGPTRISINGGRYAEWSASGRELFYLSLDYRLMSVSLTFDGETLTPSVPRELFPLPAVDTGNIPYDVAGDGQRFLVRATSEREASQPLTVIVN
jgi:hypothetical protein